MVSFIIFEKSYKEKDIYRKQHRNVKDKEGDQKSERERETEMRTTTVDIPLRKGGIGMIGLKYSLFFIFGHQSLRSKTCIRFNQIELF